MKLTRYDAYDGCATSIECIAKPNPEGNWVKYSDLLAFLGIEPEQPVKSEPTCKWTHEEGNVMARCLSHPANCEHLIPELKLWGTCPTCKRYIEIVPPASSTKF